MNVNTKKSFYYHADASALGGVLKQPLERIVSTSGSVSLAQAGGFSTARAERFDLDGLISFESAQVSVHGDESREDGGWRTLTTAVVERFNLLQVITADRIVAQLSVMHFHDGRPAEISFNGSQFVNLRLNGVPVAPKLNHDLLRRPSEEQDQKRPTGVLVDAMPRFNDLLNNADRQYKEARQDASQRNAIEAAIPRFAIADPREELEKKGTFLCSLVKEAAVEAPATAYGHQIHVPDFGNIFLGELRVSLFSAQLTMVRAEMGCIANGIVSMGTVGSNGSTMP
jgi:hypothetical protein